MTLSIVTTVLNRVSTIRYCIENVINQGVELEHIIVDGGSTDGTLEIINEYNSYFSKIISEPDEGIYDGLNKGLKLASRDIIGILNSDDEYFDSNVLSKVGTVFDNNKIDSCYGDLVYIDKDNPKKIVRYWKAGDYNSQKVYWGWMPPHPTFFVRKRVYDTYGCFNINLGSAADYELMIRFLLKHKISVAYIPEILVKMRTGGESNFSIKNRILANLNDRMAWKVNRLTPYPWTMFFKPLRKFDQYLKRPKSHDHFFSI